MCKLCNSDSIPVEPTRTSSRLEIASVVIDYTDEYPCINCYMSIQTASKRQNISYDEAILHRMSRSYINKIFTLLERTTARARLAYDLKKNRRKYTKNTYSTEFIEKNIEKRDYIDGTSMYFVVKSINYKTISKRFKTLEEAQKYRERILNENNQRLEEDSL